MCRLVVYSTIEVTHPDTATLPSVFTSYKMASEVWRWYVEKIKTLSWISKKPNSFMTHSSLWLLHLVFVGDHHVPLRLSVVYPTTISVLTCLVLPFHLGLFSPYYKCTSQSHNKYSTYCT